MDATPLLLAGVIGLLLFILVFLVDGATRPGYRPSYHMVSALALGARGWIQTTNFVVCGLLVEVAAWGIVTVTDNWLLGGVVAVFGLGLVASGIFTMDPMLGYPPGTPEGAPSTPSRTPRIYDQVGGVVFVGMPIAAAVAAFTIEGIVWVVWSAATAILTAAGMVTFITALKKNHPRTGMVQKVDIIIGWTWLAGLCAHLAS